MRVRTILLWMFAAGFFCAGFGPPKAPVAAAPQADPPAVDVQKAPLTVDQVVSQLVERNREREEALRKFVGTRLYTIKYTGFFGTHEAAMKVDVNYAAPNDKDFTIVSESGSKFIVDHVLKGLLAGEKEAGDPKNKQHTELNTDNYEFALAGVETSHETPQYVLEVKPRKENKYLYRGKIWVDGKDFAVTRIEAEPAKSPSFWVKKSEVNHRYEKVDAFWLPAENKTDSLIRMGGHAVLSIEYQDYRITDTTLPAQGAGANLSIGKSSP
jgi:hypothetical protein